VHNSVRKIEQAIASGDRAAALATFKDAELAIMRAAQRDAGAPRRSQTVIAASNKSSRHDIA
jgi:ribosomal protein S20